MTEVDTACSQARNIMIREVDSRSPEKRSLEIPAPRNEATKSPENNESSTTPVFVNHSAVTWNEDRTRWIGDESQKPQRSPKDPIISWTTTYEDLLSVSDKFSEPIPLSEMVDFLVDIWLNEGLYGEI